MDFGQSDKASGVRFRLNAIRPMNIGGLSEEQTRVCLPESSENMPVSEWQQATSEEIENWVGFRGYFRTAGEIDKFLSAIKR